MVDFKWQANDVTPSREEENMCLKFEKYNQSTRHWFCLKIIVVLLWNNLASFAWDVVEFTELCIKWLMLGAFFLCFGKVSEYGMLDFLLFGFEVVDLLDYAAARPNDTVIRPQQLLERRVR